MNTHNISYTSLPSAGDSHTVRINTRHSAARKNAPWDGLDLTTLENLQAVLTAHIEKSSTSTTRALQLTDEILGPRPVTLAELLSLIREKSVLSAGGGSMNEFDVVVYDDDPTRGPERNGEVERRGGVAAGEGKAGCCVVL